jgi:hypothetical protein
VKNESYQNLVWINICKPNLAHFTSIHEKIGSKLSQIGSLSYPSMWVYWFKVTQM